MHIAVFGAAFDPPHVGHKAIAEYLIDSGKADVIWFLPVNTHAFGKSVTAAEHRLAMVELMVAAQDDIFKIQTYELTQKTTNYTYMTLKHFRNTYLDDTFSFVIGADNLAHFHEWEQYQTLLQEFTVWVYPRTGFEFTPLHPGMIPLHQAPVVDVSSTRVRQRVKRGESIEGLVEPAVAQYIKTHHLYVKT